MSESDNLKNLLRQLNNLTKYPDYYLYEYFQNIRNQIDLSREEWKLAIDKYHDELLLELDNHELECKNGIIEKDSGKLSDNVFSEICPSIDDLTRSLDNIVDLQKKITKLKLELFNHKIYEFKPINPNQLKDNFFGRICINDGDYKKFSLISASSDKQVKFWDLESETYSPALMNLSPIFCIKFLTQDTFLMSSFDRVLKLYSSSDYKIIKEYSHCSYIHRIVRVNQNDFITGHSNGEINYWNKNNGIIKSYLAHKGFIWGLEINRKKNQLVSFSESGELKIWNFETCECIKSKINKELTGINGMKVFEEENKLLACSTFGKIFRFDLDSLNCEEIFQLKNDLLWPIEFLSDNKIATGSKDNSITIWDLETKKSCGSLVGHSGYIKKLKLISNNILVSGSYDCTLRIWDLNIKKCIEILTGHSDIVSHIDFI